MDELNILADAMKNKLGLRYKTHLINCHCHHKGFNAVCKSSVNQAFLRLQPKRTSLDKCCGDGHFPSDNETCIFWGYLGVSTLLVYLFG